MAQNVQTQRLYRETSFGGSQESLEYVDDDSVDAKKGEKYFLVSYKLHILYN